MPNEKTDPWALLAEARDAVGYCPMTELGMAAVADLRSRIDAALAAREAEEQVEVACPECAKCLDSMEGAVEAADLLEVKLRDARAEVERLKIMLAAREVEEKVEVEFAKGCGALDNAAWEEMHKDFFVANPDDYTTMDAMLIPSAGYWTWSVAIEKEARGRADTLDEAKSAAIRAARGLR